MLDANLKRNKIRVDSNMKLITDSVSGGTEVTAKFISKLAQEDVGSAVNLMSSLVNNSMIDMETMIKVFNGRYGLIVSSMLSKVDGDIQGYNDNLSKMVNLTEDVSLQANNLNVMWAKSKNIFSSFFAETNSGFKGFASLILGTFNGFYSLPEILKEKLALPDESKFIKFLTFMTNLNKNMMGITISTLALTGAIGAGTVGIIAFNSALAKANISLSTMQVGLLGVKMTLASFLGWTMVITSSIMVLSSLIPNLIETNKELNSQTSALKKTSIELGMLNTQMENQKSLLERIKSTSLVSTYSELSNIISGMESSFDSLAVKINEALDMSSTKPSDNFLPDISLIEERNKALDSLGKNYVKISNLSKTKFGKPIEDLNSLEMEGLGDSLKEIFANKVLLESTKNLDEYFNTLKKIKIEEDKYYQKSIEYENERRQAISETLTSLDNDIIKSYIEQVSTSSLDSVDAILNKMRDSGQVGLKFADDLVKTSGELGIKLTANNLKNAQYVSLLSSAVDMNNLLKGKTEELTKAQDDLNNAQSFGAAMYFSKIYLEKKEAIEPILDKVTERLKLMRTELEKGSKTTASNTKNMFDLLSITKQYELAQAKVLNLGQSELASIIAKRQELEKTYKIQKDLDQLEMRNKYKDVFGKSKDITDFSISKLKEMRDSFQSDIAKANASYINGTIGETLEDTLKGKEEMAKLLDSYIAKWVEFDNSIKESNYEEIQRKQQMVEESKALTSFLNEQKLAEMDILNINIELAKLAGVSSAQEQELAWLKEKYNLEKSILETQLRGYKTVETKAQQSVSVSKVKVGSNLTESQIKQLQSYLIKSGKATSGLVKFGATGDFLRESQKSLEAVFKTSDYTKLSQEQLDLVFGKKDEFKEVVALKQQEFTWTKEALDEEIKKYQARLDSQLASKDVNDKDKATLEELKAKRQAINDLERLKLEYAKQTAQIDIDAVTNATNKLLAEKELNLEKQKQLTTFDRMFMSTKQLNKLEASETKSLIKDKQNQNQADLDHYSALMSMLEFEDLTDEQREAKRLSYQAEINRLTSEGAKLELEWSKALTDEQLKRYELSKKTYDSILTGIEAVAKGEMLKPSTSSFRESAIASLSKKTSLGMEMKSGDYANVGAYSLSLINDFMQTEMAGKSKALDYEAKILDLRLQGAKTEEEKAELERQQLELQKQQIDLQYQQSTSFMGTSGVAGGAMSGAFSSLASKNLTKLTSGDWIGAGIGMASGILGAKSAKKDAERQKEMLEYQYKMTQYLEEMNKNIEANNTLLSMTVSEGSKVGVYRATQSAIQAVVNSSDATLGGSATSAWNNRHWHGGFHRGWEDNWITTMANYDVTDFGMTESDLTNQQNILTLLAKVKEEQTKYAQYATTYNQTEGVESQAHSNYLALQEFIDALNDLYSLQASMSPKIYKQYLGATLEAVEDSSGKITDYTVTWTDFIAEQFSSIYSSISSNIKASGNAITSSLFSGLNNMFIQNYSNLGKKGGTLDKITEIYSALGQTLSSNTSAMDMTAVNSTFVDLIAYVEQYKAELEAVNEVSDEFITMWIQNGGALSDVVSSMSSSMSSIYNSMKSALTGGDVTRLGSDIATNLVDSIATELMDSKMTQAFQNLTASFSQAMADSTLSNLGSLFSTMTSTQIAMEAQASKLQAVKDLFSSEVSYSSTENVQYTSGSSKQNVYNFSNYITVASDFTFAESEESVNRLGEVLVNTITTLQKSYKS